MVDLNQHSFSVFFEIYFIGDEWRTNTHKVQNTVESLALW